ncbi:hypothetical protein [Chitinophaga sp. HK235]|uniref:hypothetical protein n=1 Tax=Chitinophaga sp. HK235 TaxID=2952571 RepID=UPI001BA6565F|nr:hypothetical protein [Chitinophaga sp. HK235]
MLALHDAAWQQLNGPYGIDDTLPEALALLKKDWSDDLLDEIIWERIYHQNTLYENTFAAVPYLIDLAAGLPDPALQIGMLGSLAVLISEDGNAPVPDTIPAEFSHNTAIPPAQVRDIYNAYIQALQRLPVLGIALLPTAHQHMEEETDRNYFLAAIAVAYDQRAFARFCIRYESGDEYIGICAACNKESYIWPDGNQLRVYTQDPVFHKDQQGQVIVPHPEKVPAWDGTITDTNMRNWGYHYAAQLKMTSLMERWSYLFGTCSCPGCGKPVQVFDSILASI